MRYDETSEIDPEAEADEWFEGEKVLRDGVLEDINIALGPYGVDDPTADAGDRVITAVAELAGRMAGLDK